MPIVLTSNEVVINPEHTWDDVDGVQYHYPNQYKNLIKTGEPFAYYRGVRRKDGRRGQPEYFGSGIVGEIKIDATTVGQSRPSWYCAIEDYKPFSSPVSAKKGDGEFYEVIKNNMWRNGVRPLSTAVYEKIILAGGSAPLAPKPAPLPLKITESRALLVPKVKVVGKGQAMVSGWRRSNRAKQVGDWAEDAAMKFVREVLGEGDITHRAGIGETPGWDFDYRDKSGQLHRVEVKGTVGAAFTSVDLTIGEFNAAKIHKQDYWIFLVANCLTNSPAIQRISNPAEKIINNEWFAQPILYNIIFAGG